MKTKRLLWAGFLFLAALQCSAFYNPQVGRWLSRDPIDEEGGSCLYVLVANATPHVIDDLGRWPLHTLTLSDLADDSDAMDGFLAPSKSTKRPPPGKPEHPGGGQCPNNPPNVNGCGPGGWKYKIVPDKPLWMVDFTDACNAHDKCYGTCGSVKKQCDDDLLGDAAFACFKKFGWWSTKPPPADLKAKYDACIALAKTYHAAVSKGGDSAYADAQKEGCKCKCPKKE